MRRTLLVVLALGMATPAIPCGNKFLVWGRTAKMGQLSGAQAPKILLYRNKATDYTRMTTANPELRPMLKAFGLKVDTADTQSKLSKALRKREYDVVIADFVDAGLVAAKVRSGGSDAEVLPVMHEPPAAEADVAVEQYGGVLELPAEPDLVFTAIGEALERTGRLAPPATN